MPSEFSATQRRAWLTLLRAPGLGAAAIRALAARHGDIVTALEKSRRDAPEEARGWLAAPDAARLDAFAIGGEDMSGSFMEAERNHCRFADASCDGRRRAHRHIHRVVPGMVEMQDVFGAEILLAAQAGGERGATVVRFAMDK